MCIILGFTCVCIFLLHHPAKAGRFVRSRMARVKAIDDLWTVNRLVTGFQAFSASQLSFAQFIKLRGNVWNVPIGRHAGLVC